MTDDDVNRIATELGVVLPSDYRHILTHFPIRFAAGKTTEAIWDNADEIIKRNKELRSERRSLGTDYHQIPSNMLFIGDDGAGWQHLLDLSAPEPTPVYVMEFENVERISPALSKDDKPTTLSAWFHDYLVDMRDGGTDPNSEVGHDAGLSWRCIWGMLGFCLVAAFVLVLIIIGLESLRKLVFG